MLTRLAKWWLERRGHVVIEQPFFGLAIGCGEAVFHSECDATVRLTAPLGVSHLIALNHSIVVDDTPITLSSSSRADQVR